MRSDHAPPPRRVFLSHTAELRNLPKPHSFVAAAESAVTRAGDAVVDMKYFTSRAEYPADVCRKHVLAADIYVVIAGFRYGSPVRDKSSISHTELEFETATSARLPVLAFLLGEEAEGPATMFRDLEFGERQAVFRSQLTNSGLTVTTVCTPGELEVALLQALTLLPRSTSATLPPPRRREKAPLVRNFTSWQRLGVHPSTGLDGQSAIADSGQSLPTYVPRRQDDALRQILRDARGDNSPTKLVVITGPALAGKPAARSKRCELNCQPGDSSSPEGPIISEKLRTMTQQSWREQLSGSTRSKT
jgi:hypothetical protein